MSQNVEAYAVNEDNIIKVQVPPNTYSGDTFPVTLPSGQTIVVTVPDNTPPGSFISIVISDDNDLNNYDNNKSNNNDGTVTFKKAALGAAVVGGVVGGLAFGTIGAVVLAGGAVYATTRKDGNIGKTARNLGEGAYKGLTTAKNWTEKKIKESDTFKKLAK